jgi:hypothetical protein
MILINSCYTMQLCSNLYSLLTAFKLKKRRGSPYLFLQIFVSPVSLSWGKNVTIVAQTSAPALAVTQPMNRCMTVLGNPRAGVD